MIPYMVGKVAPISSHLTRGSVKYVPGRSYIRAVPSQNGEKYVTSPPRPQSLNWSRGEHSSAQSSIIFILRPVSLLGRRTTCNSMYVSIYRAPRRRMLIYFHPSSVRPVEHECAAPVADSHSQTWWANRPYICFRTVSNTRGRITRDKKKRIRLVHSSIFTGKD